MPVRNMIITSLFAALLAVSSQVAIPGPVPHTLQIVFVFLAGIVLGSRWGFVSVVIWVMLGIFGLPVFAQGKAGLVVLAGPTGGFLAGFMVCAWLVGHFASRGETFFQTLGIMLAGLFVVYALGLAGFMASFAWFLNKPMTWEKAASVAVLPFLPFDALKTVAAAYLGVRIRRALHKAGLSIVQ